MLALALLTAALAVGHADRNPTAVHGGIAFARHTSYADTFVDWRGHVRAYSGIATWSPHERYVALPYAECANGSCETWTVVSRRDGSHRHVLPDLQTGVSWSADESTLAYVDGDSLEIADGDGSNVHVVPVQQPPCGFASCQMDLADPSVSPDGSAVALVISSRSTAPMVPPRNQPGKVYVVPSTGGTPVPAGSDSVCPTESGIAWSPDGVWLSYIANECIGSLSDLEVVSADGSVLGLSGNAHHGYAWSPTEDVLAYETREGVAVAGPRGKLKTIFAARSPSWSPDGHRLTYERRGRIAILDPTTGRERTIAYGRSPTWTTHGIAWSVPQCGPTQGIWLAGRRLTDICEIDGTHGTRWRDEVWAVDRTREHVSCGAGFDVARVDRNDVVATDCERVVRNGRR